ncbi:allantoinase [Klenkia soli]|uniref:allantoinase n=1 Tax=Klenkia soli TaxID=1052260 RepID=A0A1H0F5Z0_9ACTN|nr:allantoinase AllB [Klenkia soli]SDN89972.1 allantoinase [Klenkia soli]
MSGFEVVVRAARAITPEGERSVDVGIRDGRIAAVEPGGLTGDRLVVLAADEVLLPGLVDTHVHVDEPGRTEWEGFASATRAAAAGGVTTVLDMPLNSIPPTVDVPALRVKQASAGSRCAVDVGFWGGAVPGNLADVEPLHAAGVFGFKCFLLDSGVPEFPPLTVAGLTAQLRTAARFGGLTIVHAEDADTIAGAPAASGPDHAGFLRSRPDAAEARAVAAVVAAVRETGARAHVLHVSSADVLPLLRDARAEGLPITAETCPHYLFFDAAEVPAGDTAVKCCPPVRGAANREQLWAALAEGVLDCVVTDHSPSTPELKGTGDFGTAWGGISSLQLGLPAVWTRARERGHDLADVVGWMATATAGLVGLDTKGALAVGKDADLCVLAPDATFVVDPGALHHRHPVTPYAGHELTGVVRSTWLRGAPIDLAAPPRGRLLTRGEA